VIGGGPAGTAAALTLLKYSDLKVAVIERSNYNDWCVGESLSPSGAGLLRYLGAWETFTARGHLPSYGTAAAWGSQEILTRDFLFTGRGTAWHLDRRAFDKMLAALVSECGGLLMTSAVVERDTHDQQGWQLWIRSGTSRNRAELRARFVIDASGKQASFARRNGARRKVGDHLMGIVGSFSFADQTPRDSFTLIEAGPMGWWYSAVLPGQRMAVAFMSDSDLIRRHGWHRRDRWLEWLASLRHVRARVELGTLEGKLAVCPAYSQILEPMAAEGWVAAGEAAAGFDPLSSMGIGYALTSGIEAARAVHNALTGDGKQMACYTASVARHYAEYRAQHQHYYSMEQRWPDSPFWARRR
jgi:flavin-dependent dehydrogenase